MFWRLDASRQAQIDQALLDASDKVKREREITDKMLPGLDENTKSLKRWIEIQETIWDRERRQEYRELSAAPTRRRPDDRSE